VPLPRLRVVDSVWLLRIGRAHTCCAACTAASTNRRNAALCARGRNASATGLGGASRSAMNYGRAQFLTGELT